MSRPIIVVGFGGHGRVVTAALQAAGRKIIGATDLRPENHAANSFGVRILSDEALLDEFAPRDVLLVSGLGSILPVNELCPRHRLVRRFQEHGYEFTGFQHPASWVAPGATIATTAQIHAGAIVQPGTVVGDFTILNTRSSVDHDCVVEEYCHIAPGVTVSGNVVICRGTHLGTGANLIQGLRLGAGCFVAAGATVVGDVESGAFVRGVPARTFVPKPQVV
ncbi:acetyltransferase [Aporhodopirellula aestuarii]|uniref:Acetyltransferase n=1 Tax=Aporhodopirellula aestuarii TaxID=2950107 RepID=A0ABT0UA90_9BACT|nr:acetyltransferase [Aporhodopirellula aestuarii]MCM2373845.1 acetyltransferase [Aporhodopirellula aestuarii]